VEAGLNELIERRARGARTGRDRANEEAQWDRWQTESRARRYREALLQQRLEYHEGQLARLTRTFEELLRRHRVGLRLCEEALGIKSEETEGAA
jgi:hypothetical protein